MASPLFCFRLGVGACFVSQVGYTFHELVSAEASKTATYVTRLFDFLSSAFYFTQWAHYTALIDLKGCTFPLLILSYSLIIVSSALHMRELFVSLHEDKGPVLPREKRQQELDFLMQALSVAFGALGLGELVLGLNPAALSAMGTAWIVSWVVAKSHAFHMWLKPV